MQFRHRDGGYRDSGNLVKPFKRRVGAKLDLSSHDFRLTLHPPITRWQSSGRGKKRTPTHGLCCSHITARTYDLRCSHITSGSPRITFGSSHMTPGNSRVTFHVTFRRLQGHCGNLVKPLNQSAGAVLGLYSVALKWARLPPFSGGKRTWTNYRQALAHNVVMLAHDLWCSHITFGCPRITFIMLPRPTRVLAHNVRTQDHKSSHITFVCSRITART